MTVSGMQPSLTPARELESSIDALLDAASATAARVTWGRTRLARRHWVAVEFVDGHRRERRGRTRDAAARRVFLDVYAGA